MLAWIRDWRKAQRAALLERRAAIPADERRAVRDTIVSLLQASVPELAGATIGFYWPIRGEMDLRDFVREAAGKDGVAALPVVVAERQPLEFWVWDPSMALSSGVWGIPVPAKRNVVRPSVLIVPLLGFDEAGYRLGYGGGYYDRTLASMAPRPLTVGVGYEFGRLETIHPQPHDIPMDAIATEAGFSRFGRSRSPEPAALDVDEDPNAAASYASPPCFMHELDPAYLGYMSREEILALLNQLLEGERAGAKGVNEMSKEAGDGAARAVLHDVAKDEARFCAMIVRHVERLGGTPSAEVGAFYGKLAAVEAPAERIDLLNRGQGWVARKLRDALPRIGDDSLHRDLAEMLEVHERNIERCTGIGA